MYADNISSGHIVTTDAEKMHRVSELKHEIQDLEEELRDCEVKNKKWHTATLVGAGAAAATAIGAAVQGAELVKYKRKNGNTPIDSDKKTEDKNEKDGAKNEK